MAKVTVTINPQTGERTYHVEGVGGVACEEITRVLAEANKVKEYEYTSDFYDSAELPDYLSE